MDAKVTQAYESLVPADKVVVDCVIITLAKKDQRMHELIGQVRQELAITGEAD